ncbi:MAG: EamA family transporter [Lentisphaeria bacterium]|nr:EamA family transporter [Lentisphaeria bacterium]
MTAIILVVISAVLHAGWNLLSKHGHPTASFFLLANLAGAALLLPVLIMSADVLDCFVTGRVGLLLLATGFFMALYWAALAGAYRAGDMSVAYPLARSSPVIVVAVVTLILGRGDQVSGQCTIGIALVVAGCFLIPLKQFTDFGMRNYLCRICGLALLAAVGTAGYSMLDDEALRILRESPEISYSVVRTTLCYACFEALSASLWLTIFIVCRRDGRASLRRTAGAQKRDTFITGVSVYVTYSIVLIALAFVDNVSYVVAFRQLSIPLGAAFGIVALKEPGHRPKLAGILVMFSGLVLVATG